jgi:hypothetical protein
MNLLHTFKKHKKQSILFFAITVSFFSYAYAIADTTVSISNAEMVSQDLQEIETDIAELELAFFDKIDNFSIEMAAELNMSETKMVYYSNRNEQATVAYNNL